MKLFHIAVPKGLSLKSIKLTTDTKFNEHVIELPFFASNLKQLQKKSGFTYRINHSKLRVIISTFLEYCVANIKVISVMP